VVNLAGYIQHDTDVGHQNILDGERAAECRWRREVERIRDTQHEPTALGSQPTQSSDKCPDLPVQRRAGRNPTPGAQGVDNGSVGGSEHLHRDAMVVPTALPGRSFGWRISPPAAFAGPSRLSNLGSDGWCQRAGRIR